MKHSTLHRLSWIAIDTFLIVFFIIFNILKNMMGVNVNEGMAFIIYVMWFGILIVIGLSTNEILKSDAKLKKERNERLNSRINFLKKEIESLSKLIED